MNTPTYTTPGGATVPAIAVSDLHRWTDEMKAAEKGNGGHVAALVDGGRFVAWYFVTGWIPPVRITRVNGAEPPPYPQPSPERCGCSNGEHICGCCGQPHWIEIHGMADGFCTYCYHRG